MTVTVTTLIAPARRAMIASGALTAAGVVLSVEPYVALRNIAAIWLKKARRPSCRSRGEPCEPCEHRRHHPQ